MMSRRTVLVTGGAGHVGSHVAEILAADKLNSVISLDNYFSGRAENHVSGVDYRSGSTRDIEELIPESPEIVYHLGEYSRVTPSLQEIEAVYDMNIQGTFAVAQFCRRRGAKLVYAASSTKFAVEGDGRHQTPYSWSKAQNVDLITGFGRWYKVPYAICYFYNAFGPREQGDGPYATLIAKFQRLYRTGEPLTVVAPGTQRRSFTYVKDLAAGIIRAGEKGSGDGYMLGASRSYSVLDIAEAFGSRVHIIEGNPGRAGSDIDSTKAQLELSWFPTVDVVDYIRDFVNQGT
jgi:UDP-glucose 4-epimerase